jgi:hypothetical protein
LTCANLSLHRNLLTETAKSSAPYIAELERRITLLQGQLNQAKDHNVKVMELLQLKLSQDLYGRVTERQAVREVDLLREISK